MEPVGVAVMESAKEENAVEDKDNVLGTDKRGEERHPHKLSCIQITLSRYYHIILRLGTISVSCYM